jgi:hypothetical protein
MLWHYPSIEVQILHVGGVQTLKLGEAEVVRAGPVTVVIQDADHELIRLDGRLERTQITALGRLFAKDLSRSTGFHHLQVGSDLHYWFGTEDAKLRLDGIVEMLRYLSGAALGWSGQLLFSDGSYMVEPHVLYGWLDRHADQAINALRAIARAPRRGRSDSLTTVHAGGRRVARPQTIGLLRRHGAELLEESIGGPIAIGKRRYTPRRVVVRTAVDTLDTTANRRAAWLADRLATLTRDLAPELTGAERHRCKDWHKAAEALFQTSALRPLRLNTRTPQVAMRSVVESTERNYSVMYEKSSELSSLTAWTADRVKRTSYAYVEYSDQIYQAFVGLVVGAAMGLTRTNAVLGGTNPAFRSETWDFYYDAELPPHVVRTWRSDSTRPDKPRPDVLFAHRPTGAVILGDAKYRRATDRATEDSFDDLLQYMEAFGLQSGIIFYPATNREPMIHRVFAHGRMVVEISIAPHADLHAFLSRELPTLFEELKAMPPWHG